MVDDTAGPAWTAMRQAPRRPAAELEVGEVPAGAGVYAWFRSGEPVYAGKASGRGGLRSRVGTHLGSGRDLSRSSLRRNVAEHLLGVPTSVSRQRPPALPQEQVGEVNAWIRELEVAWVTFDDPADAVAFERALLAEWMPALSKR